MKPILLPIVMSLVSVTAHAQWIEQTSGTTARLRGLCVVDERVAWTSGSGGTVLRTIDRGTTWERKRITGADSLDFRDIEAFDDRTAYALSIGEGPLSRIYKTQDCGLNWVLQFVNQDARGFLDALAFWDSRHGVALGDPVDGRFVILTTDDGGRVWSRIPPDGMPKSLPSEGAFAASGTCLILQGERNAWFGTGGGRVFRSTDRGQTWTVHETPIRAGNGSSGIFSLAFYNAEHGIAIGGDYMKPEQNGHTVALTTDGGRTWKLPKGSKPGGYRSAVAYIGGSQGTKLVAVGPTGTDLSGDGGESWVKLSDLGYHAVVFSGVGAGWAVGENGRIAWFDSGRLKVRP